MVCKHTKTKDNHVGTNDDGAQGRREELADTAQHHNHTHGDVDETTVDRSVHAQLVYRMRAMHSDSGTYKMLEKSILTRLRQLSLGSEICSGSRGLESQGEESESLGNKGRHR